MPEPSRTARLVAVGDLQLGDSATCVGFGFRSRVQGPMLADTLRRLEQVAGRSDVRFANCETPLSDLGLDPARRASRQLRGAPAYAQVVRDAGFTVLNVANNHALEHGAATLKDSHSRLAELGFDLVGRKGEGEWTSKPATREVNGLRLGMLGYCMRPVPEEAHSHISATPTQAQIAADVARLRAQADCVIVSLHWGEEFVPVPSTAEVALAHAIVDAGACLLLGHHPHVSRPVERYQGAVIVYSLGNFLADMIWYDPLRQGLVLCCDLTPAGPANVRVLQTRISDAFLAEVSSTEGEAVVSTEALPQLAPEPYVQAARDTVAAQRRGLYWYTLRNAWRFEPRVLTELASSTVLGKIRGRLTGKKDEIWG